MRRRGDPGGVDERDAGLDRRISERLERLNATRGWPWHVPGAISSGLDENGIVTRYLETEQGPVQLGP